MKNKITIVGCGPGNPNYLTTEAINAVSKAKNLLGSERLLALFEDEKCNTLIAPSQPRLTIELIQSIYPSEPVTILVSGDPGLFSLSRGLISHFGLENCHVIPGISSLQIAFSRLGIDWRDAKIISAHATDPDWNHDELIKHDHIAILGGRPTAYPWLVEKIKGLGNQYKVTLLENLTLESEQIRNTKLEELTTINIASLVIIILQRSNR